MELNRQYFTSDIDENLQKLVLFCLNENINLWDYAEEAEGRVMLVDSMIQDCNKYRRHLAKKGLIETTYRKDKTPVNTLTKPMYVHEQEVNFNIDEYRKLFAAKNIGISGRMGEKRKCEIIMESFLEIYTEYSFEDVLNVTKLYIKENKDDPQYIARADNFIKNDTGESRLLQYLENPPKEEKDFNQSI